MNKWADGQTRFGEALELLKLLKLCSPCDLHSIRILLITHDDQQSPSRKLDSLECLATLGFGHNSTPFRCRTWTKFFNFVAFGSFAHVLRPGPNTNQLPCCDVTNAHMGKHLIAAMGLARCVSHMAKLLASPHVLNGKLARRVVVPTRHG